MENSSIGIVLIHGAGLNSALWDDLRKAVGAPSLAIDFPNRLAGDNPNRNLSFSDYVDSVAGQIEKWKHSRFIIVAHSIGACVGLELLSRFDREIVGFVAIGSVIPASGNSFVTSMPVPQRWIMPLILKLAGTKPPQNILEKELCNDLTPARTQKIVREFTPESVSLYTTKITYKIPDITRLYIKLTNDKSVSPDLQDRSADILKLKLRQ